MEGLIHGGAYFRNFMIFELTQNHVTFETTMQFSTDHSFLLHFKNVTFYSNDIDGFECSDAKQKLQA